MPRTPLPASWELAAVLRWVLDSEAGRRLDPPPVVPAELGNEFASRVLEHRVATVVEPAVGGLGLPSDSVAIVTGQAALSRRASMVVQSVTASLTGAMAAAGVRCLAYKGVALAAQTTGDPAARGAGDVDLLVAAEDMADVDQVLRDLGAEPVPGWTPLPGDPLWPMASRLRPEAPYRWRGIDIDLHWRVDPIPEVAAIAFEDLWARRQDVRVAGVQVPTLGPADALLVSAVHGSKEQWREWRWVVDLVRQARLLSDAEWSQVAELAPRTGCAQRLQIGLSVGTRLGGHARIAPSRRALAMAREAWANSLTGDAPYDLGNGADQQWRRAWWTMRSLPGARGLRSQLVQLAVSTQDMTEVKLPPALALAYPALRPFRWMRRLRLSRTSS